MPGGFSRPSPRPTSRSRPPFSPGAIVNPCVRGVPIGRRSPLKRGPFSTPKHTFSAERDEGANDGGRVQQMADQTLLPNAATLVPLAEQRNLLVVHSSCDGVMAESREL